MEKNIENEIDFKNPDIIYSNSRRVRGLIDIDHKGKITVTVPYGISQENIKKTLEENKKRLIEQYKKKKDMPIIDKTFETGENFYYLGKDYKLKLTDTDKKPLEFKNNTFYLSRNHNDKKQAFIDWYKQMAKKYLSEKIEHHRKKLGLPELKLKLGRGALRLGHAGKLVFKSSKQISGSSWITLNHITISWRIILAPEQVIDYIVIHELSHFVEPGHSKEFWNIISELCPDYKEQEKWLKEKAHILNF